MTFTVYTTSEFANLDIPYNPLLKPNLLSRGSGMVVYGTAGVGKSLFCTELGWQLALGGKVFDTYEVERPLRGLYIQVEVDDYDLRERVRGIADLYGHTDGFFIHTEPTFSIVQRENEVMKFVQDCKLDFVMYDPWYMMIDGGENSIEDVRPTLDAINRIMRGTATAAIIMAHTKKDTYGKDGKLDIGMDALSGHHGLRDWPKAIGHMTGDKLTATLTWEKARSSVLPDPLKFIRLPENGVLVPKGSTAAKRSSAGERGRVFKRLATGPATQHELLKATGMERKAGLALLRELIGEGVIVSNDNGYEMAE